VAAQEQPTEEPPASEAAPADDAVSPDAPKHPMEVTDEGVPIEATEASEAVGEVEKAMEQVEEDIEEGLPTDFTIEFGDTYDWLRLTSGEWLKGEINWMRDKDIEFDSDKLDVLTFSWSKVDQLHSPRINIYVFEGKIDVTGRALVTKDKVIIETADGVESYPRAELLAIVEGEPRERNFWSTRLSVGLSANAGNTNQGQLNMHWDLARRDQRTRSAIGYDGTFGYANREQNVSRHLGTVDATVYYSRRLFFSPASAQFLNDRFQNLKLRATPGAGAGVHVFDTKKVEWDLGGALGYQYIRFSSTAAGVENPQNDGFISFRTYADFDFTDDVELKLEWLTNVVYTQIGLTNHIGRANFSVEVTDIFDLEATFKFFRTERPPPRADGTVPERNDYQIIVSLALEIG
jgi:putative salt-induced outer membrane protein YdiY